MNLFRNRTLHKLIEKTEEWAYPAREQKRAGRQIRKGLNENGSGSFEDGVSRRKSVVGTQGGARGKGTINLIKNLMRHRVNIVNENIEYDQMSGESGEDDGDALRKMLQQRMQKDSTYQPKKKVKVHSGLEDSGEEDLERGDGSGEGEDDDEEWNGRTGGPIQLENNDG